MLFPLFFLRGDGTIRGDMMRVDAICFIHDFLNSVNGDALKRRKKEGKRRIYRFMWMETGYQTRQSALRIRGLH